MRPTLAALIKDYGIRLTLAALCPESEIDVRQSGALNHLLREARDFEDIWLHVSDVVAVVANHARQRRLADLCTGVREVGGGRG